MYFDLTGGSRIVELRRKSGNLLIETEPQDIGTCHVLLSEIVDSEKFSFKRYKHLEMDFSQLLINNINPVNTLDSSVDKNLSQNDNSNVVNNKNCSQTNQHPLYTKNLSKVGYYLCIRYFELPKVLKLRKETQTTVIPFKFETRSPDEVKKPCVVKKIEHKIRF